MVVFSVREDVIIHFFMKINTKSKKVNKAWLNDHVNDPWVQLAQKEGYRARAVYKLKEIDETLRLIGPHDVVVDLGCAPGAWSQYLRRKQKSGQGSGEAKGLIVGVDLLEMAPIDGVHFIQGDFQDEAILQALQATLAGRAVDVVVSDMAPNLSGIASADAARVENLIELALDFAQHHLRPDGSMVAKVFHGAGYDNLVRKFRDTFVHSKPYKPKASRDRSAEVFLIGQKLRHP